MSRKHAEYRTEKELENEIRQLADELRKGTVSKEEAERDAYFSDPENALERVQLFARMDLVEKLHKARLAAGFTQKELARRLGTKQTYIAALECGKMNVTFSTLTKYVAACGQKIAITIS